MVAAAAITTTRNGARRAASSPATATPAGRAQPAKPWPWVSAPVAASDTSKTAAAREKTSCALAGMRTWWS